MKRGITNGRQKSQRGQTSVETAFVFSMLIFLTFSIVNLGIILHTKNIATYAAFMAGRSYQVLGSQEGADSFEEMKKGGEREKLFASEKTIGAIRAAEDIYTCALPWVKVPEGELEQTPTQFDLKKNNFARCGEGKRKYETLNVGSGSAKKKSLDFLAFKEDASNVSGVPKLAAVAGGFAEKGREPMRYGILKLKYPVPYLFNIFGIDVSKAKDSVYVPILLNPGLATGLQARDPNADKEEEQSQ